MYWKIKRKEEWLKPPERFELSTPGLQDQCSNPWATEAYMFCSPYFLKKWLLYSGLFQLIQFHTMFIAGEGEGERGFAIFNEKERIKMVKLKMETG